MMEIKGTFPLPPFFFQEIQAHGSLGDYLGNMKPGVTAGCCWTWCEMVAFGNTYVSYAGPGRTRKLPNFRRYFGSEVGFEKGVELAIGHCCNYFSNTFMCIYIYVDM